MYLLAGVAMAIFCIQWFLSAQLVPDFATMTAALVTDVEVWIGVVDPVWSSLLPRIDFSLCAAVVAIVTIGPV